MSKVECGAVCDSDADVWNLSQYLKKTFVNSTLQLGLHESWNRACGDSVVTETVTESLSGHWCQFFVLIDSHVSFWIPPCQCQRKYNPLIPFHSIESYRCYRRRGRSYHWIPNCKGIYFVANTIGCAWREFNCDLGNFLLTIYIVDSGCLVKLTTHIFLLGMNAPPPTSFYTLHKLMHSFFPSRLQIPVASHRRFPSLVPLSRTYKLSSFSALLRLIQHSDQTADCFWTVEQPQ